MTFLQAAILGIIQGITEMMPISSSLHLVIFSNLQGLPNQRLSFDIFLNIGSLLAILVFFRQQIINLINGGIDLLVQKKTDNRDFFLTLLLANLPIIIFFGLAEAAFKIEFKSVNLAAVCVIIFGVLLWICDKRSVEDFNIGTDTDIDDIPQKIKDEEVITVTRKDAMLVGLAQLLAIFPGVSRLGICFSVMRYLNYSRTESFRFSVIMSIIPVAGACLLKLLKVFLGSMIIDNWFLVFVGCICSFVFGIFSLFFMTAFFKKHSILVFAAYRVILGIFIFMFGKTFIQF